MSAETVVADERYVEQAVADLGEGARMFLERLHRGEVYDAAGEATLHLRRLRGFARLHGADLDTTESYQADITNWRAVARLAGSVIET
jgi:hypothetical protein